MIKKQEIKKYKKNKEIKKLLLEKKVKSCLINKTLTAQYMNIIYLKIKERFLKNFSILTKCDFAQVRNMTIKV